MNYSQMTPRELIREAEDSDNELVKALAKALMEEQDDREYWMQFVPAQC